MTEPKPFASLSPSLLARKGSARPAMRPQILPLHQFHEATARQMHDDLGWNDMGHDIPAPVAVAAPRFEVPAPSLAAAEPETAARAAEVVPLNGQGHVAPTPDHVPEVVRQQEAIALSLAPAAIATPAAAEPAVGEPVAEQPAPALTPSPRPASRKARQPASRRSALADGRRAAFTLRLDAERHLKLRLACTLGNRSAQQIVTEAVDRLLGEMPEVAALAAEVRKQA